jgi:UDP-N-acetylmuramoyl-tripeptide--D-alanyl-D-alanine ligase
MRATLRQLGHTPATRRIAVLGSMKELGDFAPGFHAQLAEPLAEAHVDYVVLVGDEMLSLARELGKPGVPALAALTGFAHCDGPGEAIAALEEFGLTGGDAVLVKGSNSVGLGRLVAHFVDRGR